MTKLRALHGALACGAISLATGGAAHAAVANYTIDAGAEQSNVDNACVGAIPGATGEDCSYNAIDLWGTAAWIGPIYSSSYYRDGDSPFQKDPTANPLPAAPVPDPDNTALAIAGSLAIDNKNSTSCDGDDTISGRFELEAGTRTFSGGPGTWGEESWGADTIVYVLPESIPDRQNDLGGGKCEYVFGSEGFPEFLVTQGISPAGPQTYPVDLQMGSDPIDAADGEQDAWVGPEPSGIGVGTFEGPGFQGNFGVEVTVDNAALTGGTFQCVDNFGDTTNPPVQGACNFSPEAAGTPCDSDGSHFCGTRAVLENWIMRIVVDPSGDIVDTAYAFAHNESVIFAVPPGPGANNSWDGPLIAFTATCDNCSVAKDDAYAFVTGTNATVSLPIGANDDPTGELDNTATSILIDQDPTQGTGVVTGFPPAGDATTFGYDYTATDFGVAFTDSIVYSLDDGQPHPGLVLQATVSITVEEDIAPVANAYTIDFDSVGVDPITLRNTTDVLTGVAGNAGGNNPVVSVDNTAQSGTATASGSEITYAASAGFFQGTDTFNYSIDDDNFASPGVAPEAAGPAQVTVNIPNVVPTTSDVSATVEAGNSVDFLAAVTLGNGSMDQHTVDGDCDNGTVAINGLSVNGAVVEVTGTYTAPGDFSGDATCTYTVTDEGGAGDAVDGVVTIEVTESGVVIKLPGAGSALSPLTLALLVVIPLLRRRKSRPGVKHTRPEFPGVH